MECSSSGGDLRASVEGLLAAALEKRLIEDAVIADSERQAKDFWRIRHSISEAINGEGLGARHDVSVATADIPAFLTKADAIVAKLAPGSRVVAFGHIGDGNVHYDIVPPIGAGRHGLDETRKSIEAGVYDVILSFNGSISAEHGVGRHKREAVAARKAPVELAMMRALKDAIDPQGIMNPGKVL
jgi:FAD/FMN-containing dehydrogenase